MKLYIKLSLLLTLSLFIVIGCSDQENEESQAYEHQENEENQSDEEENDSEETSASQEKEESVGEDGNVNDSNGNTDPHIDHQEGLGMGETGIVVDNSENRYEVTLNSIEYEDIVGGTEAIGDTHAIVNITVKNIGEDSFDARDIYEPSFGVPGDEGLQATLNPLFIDDPEMVDHDLLEGEVAPGESVSGVHIYDIEKGDEYRFIIGGSGHQIITYAQWEVSDSEIE